MRYNHFEAKRQEKLKYVMEVRRKIVQKNFQAE